MNYRSRDAQQEITVYEVRRGSPVVVRRSTKGAEAVGLQLERIANSKKVVRILSTGNNRNINQKVIAK